MCSDGAADDIRAFACMEEGSELIDKYAFQIEVFQA